MPTRSAADRKLPRRFYDRPTLDVCRDLIGKVLVHRHRNIACSGAIVEVEAYVGESDPACHAAPGRTFRNGPLYGPPGFAYVYLNYGLHYLVNVVTEPEGQPAAVLVRSLVPLEGIPAMRRRRARPAKGRSERPGLLQDHELCRGPGNLTMALGITGEQNRVDLLGEQLYVVDRGLEFGPVVHGPRIGIRVGLDRSWRFYVEGHQAVSGNHKTRRHHGA